MMGSEPTERGAEARADPENSAYEARLLAQLLQRARRRERLRQFRGLGGAVRGLVRMRSLGTAAAAAALKSNASGSAEGNVPDDISETTFSSRDMSSKEVYEIQSDDETGHEGASGSGGKEKRMAGAVYASRAKAATAPAKPGHQDSGGGGGAAARRGKGEGGPGRATAPDRVAFFRTASDQRWLKEQESLLSEMEEDADPAEERRLLAEQEVASLETGGALTGDPEPNSLDALADDGSVNTGALRAEALSNTPEARHHFAQAYKSVARQHMSTYDHFHRRGEPDPMFIVREYIRHVGVARRLPWPVLLRQSAGERALDAAHLGMGDDFGRALAHTIPMSKHLHTINVRDNRLGDEALERIMAAVAAMPTVTSLDLSHNDIGPMTSQRMREYLSGAGCTLQHLSLDKADVDDFECKDLMISLGVNMSVRQLDLADNLIGEAENLNVVQPEFITGGESLAEMLSVNVTLTHLDLRWNSIRGDSAAALGSALAHNQGLQVLLLAHNAFANEGTQALARALQGNAALLRLDLSFNSVVPAAALVLAAALRANRALRHVNLDGNKVGLKGGAALVSAVRAAARPERSALVVTLQDCDTVSDPPGLFAVEDPGGQRVLRLDDPYQHMVAGELLRLANARDGCRFTQIIYTPNPKKRREKKNIKLTRPEPRDSAAKRAEVQQQSIIQSVTAKQSIDESQLNNFASTFGFNIDPNIIPRLVEQTNAAALPAALARLHEDAAAFRSRPSSAAATATATRSKGGGHEGGAGRRARGPARASINQQPKAEKERPRLPLLDAVLRALFEAVDADRSGALNAHEIQQCMQHLGLGEEFTLERCKQILAIYDLDGSGTMDVDEFVTYMTKTHGKAVQVPKAPLVDDTGRPWQIPAEGLLKVTFVAEPQQPSADEVGSDAGVAGLCRNLRAAPSAAEKQRLFDLATASCDLYFTDAQAYQIINLCKGVVGKLHCLERILPHVSDPIHCGQIVDGTLTTLTDKVALKLRMGYLWGCVMGYPTGFYSLDLRDPRDRRAARKLSERANGEKRFGKYRSGRGDTSQWANWENFRNGVLNRDQAMGRALTAAWFAAALPAAGRLRFDYVGTTPPSRGMKPVADTKFKNFLTALEINPDENALDMESLGTAQYEHFLEQYGKERYETAAEVEWRRLKESRYRRPVPIEERVDKTEVDPRTLIGSTAGTRSNSQDPTTMGPPAEGQRGGGGGGGGGGGAPLQGTGRRRSRSSSLQGGRRRSVSGRSSRLGSKDFGPMEPPISVAPKTALTMGKITKLIKAKSLKTLDEIASLDGSTSSLITKESGATQESLNLHPLFNPLYHRELGTEHPTEAWRRAWFKLLQLQCALCQKGLTVAQVAVLLTKFPRDDLFWVTAIVGLFNTIVDWENMHLVLDELTGEEYLEIAHRLGYLNLINPVHPDRLYAMDLSIPDQRELCSIFARLAIIEPGDNWIHESYRRSWDIVPIPGWELPRGWCEDPENRTGKGLRDFGIVTLTYQSDGANCDPNWAERNFLKSKTLCGSNRPY